MLRLSECLDDNAKARIDAGYFRKHFLLAADAVEAMPHEELGELVEVFRKGIFDIKANTYVDPGEGVPFVRIADLRNGLISKATTAWISHSAHAAEEKTLLSYGDIVLSKTAYPAASFVNLSECNVSQDTIAVKLSKRARARYCSGYIVAFLNSSFGLPLMERQFQGNVQQHLSLDDGKKLSIPKLGLDLQRRVDSLIRSADKSHDNLTLAMEAADAVLRDALGLANWSPPEPLSYTARFKSAFSSARLDAQYYMPAKAEVLRKLAERRGATLGDRFSSIKDLFDPKAYAAPPLVRNYDVTDALEPVLDDEKTPQATEEIGSTKKNLQDGDVAISRLRAYLKEIAVVRTDGKLPAVGSSEFIVLRPRSTHEVIAPETLTVFLRFQPVQTILKWCQDGSQHPRFSESDLLAIPLPDAVERSSPKIEKLVHTALDARKRARDLLETAKRATEIAIGDSEKAALRFLKDAGV